MVRAKKLARMEAMKEGLVVKNTGSWVTVAAGHRLIDCKVKGRFRTQGIKATNPVVVGDKVRFYMQENEPIGLITELLDRKNYIVRRSIKLSKQRHVMAANIDQALLVVTVRYPETMTQFIDRFLVSADAYRIPVVLVFNKMDLYTEKEVKKVHDLQAIYEPIGYTCLLVSAEIGEGLDALQEQMKDKVNVIAGHSGVGKSTLLNKMDPNLQLKVGLISDAHKTGKHTTTFTEMFPLHFGGYIIDTPGIKGFGLVDLDKSHIAHHFPEMFSRLQNCKFYNCSHVHEPGCAVLEALEAGKIAPSRYLNYLDMMEDDGTRYRKNKYEE